MAKQRRDTLEKVISRFAADVERAAGDNLVSLVLYGSAARGTATDDSDVNLLLVLRDASAAGLRPLGDVVRAWAKAGERPPLIFSEAGWRASADVFPIEIEDVREAHRVLRGADPVEGITTHPTDLRRELERETRGKLIQLNAQYAAAVGDGKALTALVAASARTFLHLLRAGVRAAGRTPPDERRALVAAAAKISGFDPEAFDWPLAKMAGESRPDLAAHDPAAARYLDALSSFVDYVDRASA